MVKQLGRVAPTTEEDEQALAESTPRCAQISSSTGPTSIFTSTSGPTQSALEREADEKLFWMIHDSHLDSTQLLAFAKG